MQDKIRYELTAHAATVMAERKILAAWVERLCLSSLNFQRACWDEILQL